MSRVSKAAAQLSLEPFSSATRQIVAGRIIEADTIEGFIFRALGARRGEGSSITRAEETIPTLPYLTLPYLGRGRMRRVGKEARSARMPGPIPPRRLEKLDPSAAR